MGFICLLLRKKPMTIAFCPENAKMHFLIHSEWSKTVGDCQDVAGDIS